jgi:hypothetical protein
LLAVPHLLLVAALTGPATWQLRDGAGSSALIGAVSPGLLIAGISLLLTGRCPRGLYDLLLGIARWSLRTIAYLALLTGRYPPFRLDQGDEEPDTDPAGPADSPSRRPADADVPQPASPTEPQGSVAGPVAAMVTGIMTFLLAVGTGLSGAALIGLSRSRDADGYLTSQTLRVSTSTAAVTVEDVDPHIGDLWSRNLGDIGWRHHRPTPPTGPPTPAPELARAG